MNNKSGKDTFQWMWNKQNEEAKKLYEAKKIGKENRRQEKKKKQNEYNSLFIKNLPTGLQNITNKKQEL